MKSWRLTIDLQLYTSVFLSQTWADLIIHRVVAERLQQEERKANESSVRFEAILTASSPPKPDGPSRVGSALDQVKALHVESEEIVLAACRRCARLVRQVRVSLLVSTIVVLTWCRQLADTATSHNVGSELKEMRDIIEILVRQKTVEQASLLRPSRVQQS